MEPRANITKLFLTILFVFISIGFIRTTLGVVNNSKRLGQMETEVKQLESKKTELQELIEYRQSSEYIEEIARNELNYAQDGERVYIVPDKSDNSVLNDVQKSESQGFKAFTTNDTLSPDGRPNVLLWFDLFF